MKRDCLQEILDADKLPDPRGWIQWKGTQVCIDLHCTCGYLSHFDGDFFYYFECPECHRKFAVGQNVRLHPLDAEQVQHAEQHIGFKLGEGGY